MPSGKARMNRLFAKDGRCFDVAIDHGCFNEFAFLSGIEDMERAVTTIAEAGPDAIQLTVGWARILQSMPGPRKPALVLRTDVANVYNRKRHDVFWSAIIDDPVGQAFELDAACVVVNLLLLPDQPELHRQCVANICTLRPRCEQYGMPLMVEPLVMRPNEESGGYMGDGDLTRIMPLVRQAVELGADIIKADPCDHLQEFHRVIAVCGRIPVLVRGGAKGTPQEIFQRTFDVMQQGAAGIVYGRNVIQHPDPAGMTRAFMKIVHENATPTQAMTLVRE